MPEQVTPNESSDGKSGATSPAPQPDFTPITSQDDLNKVIKERIDRERAKFADYADVKAKAAQLDKIEEANKTEAQKTADRITQLEAEIQATQLSAKRFQIVAEFALSETQAATLAHIPTEQGMREVAAGYRDAAANKARTNNVVPREGQTSQPKENELAEFAKQLFQTAD
jgi:hypothetical protein